MASELVNDNETVFPMYTQNIADTCALSLSFSGLPLALSIVTRRWDDANLLRVAARVRDVVARSGWHPLGLAYEGFCLMKA